MAFEALSDWVRGKLSPERYHHVEGVVAMAEELSLRHGVDSGSSVWAAWMHDALKESSLDFLRTEARRLHLPDELCRPDFILHATVMGRVAKEHFGAPAEVSEAITYHPVGKVGLSPVGQVLYLADKLEAGRTYTGVEELREAARKDLIWGFYQTLKANVRYLESQGTPPHVFSLGALKDIERRMETERDAGPHGS